MTRGAKGCLLTAGAMLIVLVVVAAAVMLAGGVQKGTVLQVTVAGDVVEDFEDSLLNRVIGGQPTVLRDIITAIGRAKGDDRINGIMAIIKPYSMGLGKVQEIRDAIIEFRSSGKWAHVYMDTAGEFGSGNSVYYLSTAFDDISLSPAGDVNLYGILSVTTFLRGTFDKVGIYPDFDSIGKFKNAKDIYTEKKMTDAHREATLSYMNDWYGQIVAGIAEGRKMEKSRVEGLINQGPFTGAEALASGLVDRLAYYDEFESALKERNGGELATLKFKDYLDRKGGSAGHAKIAVVTGYGIILNGKSSVDPMVGPIMGSETIVGALRKAREDRTIKAIVFRVDSPGGSAVASDLIWRETQLAKKEKPIIISMSDLAASGGYYVAAGATKIVTQPGTITGSIGVVAGKLVTSGLYDWIGLNREALPIGDHATFYYEGSRYSEVEKELYWKFMKKIYEKFTMVVAEGRAMTKEDVDKVGQGHVWTGARAKELGLVDELGGMSKAIELAKKEAGISEDEEVRLVYLPQKKSFVQNLLWPEEETAARVRLPRGLQATVRQAARLSLLQSENAWLIEPSQDPAP